MVDCNVGKFIGCDGRWTYVCMMAMESWVKRSYTHSMVRIWNRNKYQLEAIGQHSCWRVCWSFFATLAKVRQCESRWAKRGKNWGNSMNFSCAWEWVDEWQNNFTITFQFHLWLCTRSLAAICYRRSQKSCTSTLAKFFFSHLSLCFNFLFRFFFAFPFAFLEECCICKCSVLLHLLECVWAFISSITSA